MKKQDSYRDSHKAFDKGISYDQYYAEQPWQRFLWSRERDILLIILKKHLEGKKTNLLDFACGTGRITAFLEDYVTTSIGVDVSTPMLEEARRKLNRTEIIQADITKENVLAGRKFNLITAFRFFLNAEEDLRREALDVITSLLSEDGYFVFNNHRNITSPLVRAAYVYNRIRGGNTNFMTMRKTRNLVENAGLEIVDIYPIGFLPLSRLSLPTSWNRCIDKMMTKIKWLSFFSESPVIVCRRSKDSQKTVR